MWLVGPHLVRCGPPDVLAAEVERHNWLAEHSPMPELAVALDEWLVTVDVGHPVPRPELQPNPDEVPAVLGAAMAELHRLDPASCPFDGGWSSQLTIVEQAVEAKMLDASTLPDPYGRYRPDQLLAMIVESQPSDVDAVVCLGTPVASNLFLRGGVFCGAVGVNTLGIADRHRDLAVCHRSLLAHFGPEALLGFYEGYGTDPDLVRLDHYILIDVVLAAVASESDES